MGLEWRICPRVSSFPIPFQDLDVTHNRLMQEQENNWSLCEVVSEGDRLRKAHLPLLLTYSYCLVHIRQLSLALVALST